VSDSRIMCRTEKKAYHRTHRPELSVYFHGFREAARSYRGNLIEKARQNGMIYSEAHAPCLERKKERHSLETIMSSVHKVSLGKNKRVRGETFRVSHARAMNM
jgi:hypothetical protein